MIKRLAAVFTVVCATMLVLPAGAHASSTTIGCTQGGYPPCAAVVTVSDPAPPSGGTITVTVFNCQAGETVRFTLEGQVVTATCIPSAPGDPSGVVSAQLTVPIAAGPYTGTAELLTSNGVLPFTVTVQAPPASTIPQTGSNGVGQSTAIAVSLVILGGALLLVAGTRRRRAVTAA